MSGEPDEKGSDGRMEVNELGRGGGISESVFGGREFSKHRKLRLGGLNSTKMSGINSQNDQNPETRKCEGNGWFAGDKIARERKATLRF